MALTSSGAISILDVANELGGNAPHSLNEYYAGGANVPGHDYAAGLLLVGTDFNSTSYGWGASYPGFVLPFDNGSLSPYNGPVLATSSEGITGVSQDEGFGGATHGRAIAGNESLIVVGARYGHGNNVQRSGMVFVYDFDYQLLFTILAPDLATYDAFGSTVAISSTVIVVGAMSVDNPNDAGAAYVYGLDGTFIVKVRTEVPTASDQFSRNHVEADAGIFVVTEVYDDDLASDSGALHIFNDDGSKIAKVVPTTAPNHSSSRFGTSMSMAYGRIAVVSNQPDNNQLDRVTILDYEGTEITTIDGLTLVGTVAVGLDFIAVGLPFDQGQTGMVVLFSHEGVYLRGIQSSVPANSNYFGRHVVAMHDRIFVASSGYAANNVPFSGAIETFMSDGTFVSLIIHPDVHKYPDSPILFGMNMSATPGILSASLKASSGSDLAPPLTTLGNLWFHYIPSGTSYRGDWQVMEVTLGDYSVDFGAGVSAATGWKFEVLGTSVISPVGFTGFDVTSSTSTHRFNWDANGTPSGSTGVVDNGYIYAETSSGSNTQFVLRSEDITLAGTTDILFNLVYGRYGSNIGTCAVYWRSADLSKEYLLTTTPATSSSAAQTFASVVTL